MGAFFGALGITPTRSGLLTESQPEHWNGVIYVYPLNVDSGKPIALDVTTARALIAELTKHVEEIEAQQEKWRAEQRAASTGA